MNRIIVFVILSLLTPVVHAQRGHGPAPPGPTGTQLVIGTTPIPNGTNTNCLIVTGKVLGQGACGGGGLTPANPTATAGPTANNGVALTYMRSDASPAVQLGSATQKGIVQVDGTTITAVGGVISAVVGGTPGGTNTQVQYNNSGSFGGITGATTNGTTLTLVAPVLGTPASVTLTNATGLPISGITGLGTGVGSALGTSLSNAGGITSTIASGTAALGVGAISSGTCATVVTVSATNVVTTDTLTASFNGDPTSTTGYIPSTSGMLTIIGYPTLNNVNFKVCNNTSGSITPGAVTVNWRVVR